MKCHSPQNYTRVAAAFKTTRKHQSHLTFGVNCSFNDFLTDLTQILLRLDMMMMMIPDDDKLSHVYYHVGCRQSVLHSVFNDSVLNV